MPGELNYYSRYTRRKDHKNITSLMRKFQTVRPSALKIISAYHNYAHQLSSSIQEAAAKLQTQQSQSEISQPQQPSHEDKSQSEKPIQRSGQVQKDIQTQKPSINILHTFSVHESVGGSEEQQLSQVIKEQYNNENRIVEEREEDNVEHSYSFGDVLQHQITFRNSDVCFTNSLKIDYPCKSQKLIRAINHNIQMEQSIIHSIQDEVLETEQQVLTHQQVIQPIQQFSLEFKVNKLEEIPQTKSSNSDEGRAEHSKIEDHKSNDRKPFKKVMMEKKLNPRLVTSTILNDQQKPKKVNFKKVLKQVQEGERKEKKIVMREKKKSAVNDILLQAFFSQN